MGKRLQLVNQTILLAETLTDSPQVYAGMEGVAGLVNGTRLESRFKAPRSVVGDRARGGLYLADSENHVIRVIPLGSGQSIETLAGNGQPGSSDGSGAAARFNNPQGVALDGRGFLWVADTGNHTIRRINLQNGEVTTVAGRAGVPGFQDGQGNGARFSFPKGIAIRPETLAQQLAREQSGLPPPSIQVLVADSGNDTLRIVDENGLAETILTRRNRDIGPLGNQNDLSNPRAVASDSSGNIHVSEEDGEVVTILSSGEVVETAQSGTFQDPQDLLVGSDGSVVVAESGRTGQRIVFGTPQIFSLTPDAVAPDGGDLLIIEGRNFAPESIVVVDGRILSSVTVRDTGSIAVRTPALSPGLKTLTVLNRGGIDQAALGVPAPPLDTLPPGYITTVAGGSDFTGDGGLALEANLREPLDITIDPAGNLIFADSQLHRVRRIDAQTGVITTVLGTGRQDFSPVEGGLAIATSISNPRCVVSDKSGNLYVCVIGLLRIDADSGLVRKITGGEGAFGGDGGPARDAVSSPQDLVIEEDGNLLITDLETATVRRIDVLTGLIDSVVRNGSHEYSGDEGPALEAGIDPQGLILDLQGNLYISDFHNYRIRRVDAVTGLIDTVVGGLEGPFTLPLSLALDGGGNLFFTDQNSLFRVDVESGQVQTLGDNFDDGDDVPLADFRTRNPRGITFDGGGNLYFAEWTEDRIRRLNAVTHRVTTIAGREAGRVGDGRLGSEAILVAPVHIDFDADENLYIADLSDNHIRRVSGSTGIISTVAGAGEGGFIEDGTPALERALIGARGLAVLPDGQFYVSDQGGLVFFDKNQLGFQIARADENLNPPSEAEGGPVSEARVDPFAITLDEQQNLYVAEPSLNLVRRIDAASKTITTVAGTSQPGYSGDGASALAAQLNSPRGARLDSQGNVFIADANNFVVRRVDAETGIITTVAGIQESGNAVQGELATETDIGVPENLAFDAQDNLYILSGRRVWRVDAAGGISIIAGSFHEGFGADGIPAQAARFSAVTFGLAISPSGNLYVSDVDNMRVRAIKAPFPSEPSGAQIVRIYEFDDSAADALGGTDIVTSGGRFKGSAYIFEANQGLTLENPFANDAEYSFELLLSLDDLSGSPKIFDLRNLQSDIGIYLQPGRIEAFGGLDAPALQSGQPVHLVWTRNALTSRHDFYVNGQHLGTLSDSRANFVLQRGASLRFFMDDFATNQQNASSGRIDRLRAYDGVLTATQVTALFAGGDPPGF